MSNLDDKSEPTTKRSRYCLSVDGRTYSQAQSFRLRQRQRNREYDEALARVQKVEEWFALRTQLLADIAERENETTPPSCSFQSPNAPSKFLDVDTIGCEPANNMILNAEEEPSTDNLLCADDDQHSFYDVVTSNGYDVISDNETCPALPMHGSTDNAVESFDEAAVVNILEEEDESSSHKQERSLFQEKISELHTIFTLNGVTLRGQQSILKFFKDLPDDIRSRLPIDGRTLRPPSIAFSRRIVSPGIMMYFGIERILNWAPNILFDQNCNEILLSANMDGVPLTRSVNGKSFWPILCNIKDYPTFPVAAFEGVKKPACANDYIREFVAECKKLCKQGVKVNKKVYKFRLASLTCDSPAASFITGIKQHGGFSSCRRCKTTGKSVTLNGVNTRGKAKKGVRYPEICDEPRQHEDFVVYARCVPDPHKASSQPISTVFDLDEYIDDDDIFFHDDADHVNNDMIDNMNNDAVLNKKSKRMKKTDPTLLHHIHPTILTEIPNFDIVNDVVLDTMHLLGGVTKTFLQRWRGESKSSGSAYKLPNKALDLIETRLKESKKYCPCEFQRKPEALEYVSSWKFTQFRQFVSYISVVILPGALDEAYLNHFLILVVAIRKLCRRIPMVDNLKVFTAKIAAESRELFLKFLELGNELYSENFSLQNTHHLCHLPDDYERFQVPLDLLSAYRYENTLGIIKRLILGHCEPLVQLKNKLSCLIHRKLYEQTKNNRVILTVDEFYEIPELHGLLLLDEDQISPYDIYKELRFRNFKLRTDNTADCFCFISEKSKDSFVWLKKISRHKDTNEIYLTGHKFESRKSLFTLAPAFPDTSVSVGINLCYALSTTMHTFHLSQLNEKCFGLPRRMEEKHQSINEYSEWVLIRYLH